MAMASSGANVRGMFDRIAHRYDHANRVMSAGIDVLWRRKAISLLMRGTPDDARFLDLGAGTLDGALAIAAKSPTATVVAADFARNMLAAGRRKKGADRISAQVADGHALPYRDQVFDGAFSAFCVRNLYDLPRALAELRRVLRPGAQVAILEFFRPEKRRWFWDGFYNPHVLPLLGRAITGDRAAYEYLPDSIGRFRSLAEFLGLLREAGFADAAGTPLFPSGIASLVTAR